MAFCPNCGAQVEGKFCAKCGSAVGVAPAPGAYTPPPGDPGGYTPPPGTPGGGYAPPPAAPAAAGMQENVAAALCYLLTWLTGILFLVLEPYNKNRNIRFHAFQAIFFGVAFTVLWIVVSMLTVMLSLLGLFFISFLHMILGLGFLAIWIFLMYKAYNNERYVLPIIGPLAEKQA